MRFQPTQEQAAFREEISSFVASKIAPTAGALDHDEQYPAEILNELGERRYTGITLPSAYDGLDKGLVEYVMMIEELSTEMMPIASAVALHLNVATVLERFGSDDLKAEYLASMARFETVGALGLSERNAGSDKLAMVSRAEKDGGGWRLSGHKQWVTNAQHADFILLYAKTGPSEDSPHNISAFLVPAAAVTVDHVWETLGLRSVKSVAIKFSNVYVSDDHVVGPVGEAYVQRGSLSTGVNVPARAVGIARAALEDTVRYAKERHQFDQPIADYQGIQWRIATMAQRVDASRLFTLRAADLADRGHNVDRELSMAKAYATEAAVEVTNDALQTYGGVGYTADHDIERYLRDARLLTIAGGPNELHLDKVASLTLE